MRLDHLVGVAIDLADRHEVCLLASDATSGGVKIILMAGAPDAVEDGEGRMLAAGRALLDADVGLPVAWGSIPVMSSPEKSAPRGVVSTP